MRQNIGLLPERAWRFVSARSDFPNSAVFSHAFVAGRKTTQMSDLDSAPFLSVASPPPETGSPVAARSQCCGFSASAGPGPRARGRGGRAEGGARGRPEGGAAGTPAGRRGPQRTRAPSGEPRSRRGPAPGGHRQGGSWAAAAAGVPRGGFFSRTPKTRR